VCGRLQNRGSVFGGGVAMERHPPSLHSGVAT
jgi:hypothetical protein